MDYFLLIIYSVTVISIVYLISRIKILKEHQYAMVKRDNKIIMERYGGIIFLLPFKDTITILSVSEQDTPVETILFHEDHYLDLNMNIKWQIENPKDTAYGFDLHYHKNSMGSIVMNIGEILVSIFKYITVGSDMDEITSDLDKIQEKMCNELGPILANKGIKLIEHNLTGIDLMDPVEFKAIKSKYQRINLRKHESDNELNMDMAKHTSYGGEVYVKFFRFG